MAETEADKFDVLTKIGQGSFGIIRKVRRKTDGLVSAFASSVTPALHFSALRSSLSNPSHAPNPEPTAR